MLDRWTTRTSGVAAIAALMTLAACGRRSHTNHAAVGDGAVRTDPMRRGPLAWQHALSSHRADEDAGIVEIDLARRLIAALRDPAVPLELEVLRPHATAADPADQLGAHVVVSREPVNATRRVQITDALVRAAGSSDGIVGLCFDPRHALAFREGGHRIELLICLECLQVETWRDGVRIGFPLPIEQAPLAGVLPPIPDAGEAPHVLDAGRPRRPVFVEP